MKKCLIIYFLMLLQLVLRGQQKTITGRISFISSQNIYVKFASTENIQKGDTLYLKNNGTLVPILEVNELSSISCVCRAIGPMTMKISDEVIAFTSKINQSPTVLKSGIKDSSEVQNRLNSTPQKKTGQPKDQLVRGRLSVSSYSNFSNSPNVNNTRLRYTLSLSLSRLGSPKLSSETYVTYSYNTKNLSTTTNKVFNSLKIYSLALKYQATSNLNIWAGRKINPKISSLGSIDGLQTEYNSKKLFMGIVAGSRPDYFDYSFNFNLPEYGIYFGQHSTLNSGTIQSTLGIFQQNNRGKTDRRFVYFQHDNSITKNINLFISSEIDLYKVQNGLSKNAFSLTSLYVSLAYRVTPQLSLFGSYDERKNVIYYETFKSFLDQLIENASRQGAQVRINYRPDKIVNLGFSAGHQFRTNDLKSTNNFSGYLTFNQLPWEISYSTISANLIRTAYLDGKIAGLKIYKDFFNGIINAGLGYQFVNYNLIHSNTKTLQHITDLEFSYRITKKLSLSMNLEKTFNQQSGYTTLYANLVKRF